jgi:uncharacterized Zn finger protein
MGTPSHCPHCGCADVRLLTPSDILILVFRCHDCGQVFHVNLEEKPSGTEEKTGGKVK